MTTDPQPRRVRVATSCTREQVQEIRIHAGDSLAVGHRNQQHPAFVWSATEDGHHGWVPEEYIELVHGRDAVALRDYDSDAPHRLRRRDAWTWSSRWATTSCAATPRA